ncbi:MAG: lipoprotein LpqH [Corynebacterium sp.]|uniref:lipoprotein LpqH n=1 Tax=Corynebacterium sp. TaxID=1720 RepID=UPI003F049753
MNIRTTRRRTAAAALGIAVVGALAACGDDNSDENASDTAAPETVTETVTADQGAPSDTTSDNATESETRSPENGSAGGGGSVATLVFDGSDLASQFTEVQCRQDGTDEFEIDLWNDDRTDHVEVDLDIRDAPRVDGLGVDREGKEWESTDTQERDATVEVDGDTYRVNGQLEVDDDHPDAGDVADLELEVSCA